VSRGGGTVANEGDTDRLRPMATAPAGDATFPLEPPHDRLAAWFHGAVDLALRHVATLSEQPAHGPAPSAAELAAAGAPVGEEGSDPLALLKTVIEEWVPKSFTTAGPGYLAYIPGGGLPTAALADLVAGLTNRFIGIAAAAPLLVRMETSVLRWLLDEFRFPVGAQAVLTSGGSVANLIALAAARDRMVGAAVARGVVYVSDQVHHSNTKAAHLVGFQRSHVRLLPVDPAFRLNLDALATAVAADRAAGLLPAVVIGNAGTVHSGAVDPLAALADFCARERLWFHIDGAYGACFQLCTAGRARLAGIERADSLSLDPHKGFFLPYGTGGVLVRDGADLRQPFAQQSAYLPQASAAEGLQDFTDASPELSRDFRGLRLWLSLKTFGARAFRDALAEKLALAARAQREIATIPGLELTGPCDLSLFAFRVARPGAAGDELSRELLVRVNRRQRVFLSGTQLGGRFVLRICVLSFRTHADRIDAAVTAVREETAALLAGR